MSNPGSGPGQLNVKVVTSGTCSYTWETVVPGQSGAGTFSGNLMSIIGLPATGLIRLRIDTTNFRQFKMAKGPDRRRLTGVEQWGDVVWANMDSAFAGCSTIFFSTSDTPDLSRVETMAYMFDSTGIYSMNYPYPVDFSAWNTSHVKNMEGMYKNQEGALPIMVGWDVSNVENMAYMFFSATNPGMQAAMSDSLPLGSWNTSKVKTMREMFSGITLTSVMGLGNWDVSSVEDMSGMFSGIVGFYAGINPVGMQSWNVSSVKDMSYMFAASDLSYIDVTSWDVSGVLNMAGMFFRTKNFSQPIGNWNVSNVTNMKYMFGGTEPLEPSYFNLPLDNWDVSNVLYMDSMFMGSRFNQPLGSWTFNSQVSAKDWLTFTRMDCKNYTQSLIGWSLNPLQPSGLTLGVGYRSYDGVAVPARDSLLLNKGWAFTGDYQAPGGCGSLGFRTRWSMDTAGSGPGQLSFEMQSADSCRYVAYFGNQVQYGKVAGPVATITGLPLSGLVGLVIMGDSLQWVNFSQTPDRHRLLQVQEWGPAYWTRFDSAFAGCVNLNVTASDTPRLVRVRNMAAMFDSCVQLLGISSFNNWHTDSVSNMSRMFRNAKMFNAPLYAWHTANVGSMQQMFKGAAAFNQDLSGWNTGKVVDMGEMFSGATAFNQAVFQDVSKVKFMGGMFRNCSAFNRPIGLWDVRQVRRMEGMLQGAAAFDQPMAPWVFHPSVNTTDFLQNTGMTCHTYDSCLRGWASQNQPSGISLDAQRAYGDSGIAARNALQTQKGWVFNDYWTFCTPLTAGGQEAPGVRISAFYPNPAQQLTHLDIESPVAGELSWQLSNLQGQVLRSHELRLNPGTNQISIPLQSLAPGLYTVALEWKGKRVVRRLEVGR